MPSQDVPEEEHRPEVGSPGPNPVTATDPALRRRRTVLRTLFGLAVLVVIAVTAILMNTGAPPAEENAAAEGSSPTPAATSSAPSLPSASPRASVSASASSSVTPSPSARSSAAAAAAASIAGWPNATNTGTPKGVALHNCPTKITRSATYDRCRFPGGVTVRANNVKISRSLVTGQIDAGSGDQHGLVVTDTTIDCGCLADDTHAPAAVLDSNFTLLRVNIFNSGHGAAVKNNVVIQDSYIHGLGANTDAHKDGIYAGDGSNVVLRHNNIECADGSSEGCTAAIGLLNDFGNISNWVIDDNLLNTNGAYCLYGGGGTSKSFSSNHITFINNHFGRSFHSKCGAFGPVTYFDSSVAGNVWRNNVWADSGAQVGAEN
jgi:hypothetical protein